MSEEIKISVYRSPLDMASTFAATIQDQLCESTSLAIIRLVAEKIAERYVEHECWTALRNALGKVKERSHAE